LRAAVGCELHRLSCCMLARARYRPLPASATSVGIWSIHGQRQPAAGAKQNAPDFVGAEFRFVFLRRLTLAFDAERVFAGRQFD